MFCPQCKAEYRVGFVRCSDCDVELVDQLPPEPPRVPSGPPRRFGPDAKLVVVRSYLNGFDAALAKSVLEAAGIDAELRGYEVGELAYNVYGTGADLVVREEDAATADEILNTDATPLSGTDS